MADATPDPSALLPPPQVLRERLSRAMRDVDVLSGLLKLSERVARRDGHPAPRHVPRPADSQAAVPTAA